MIKLTGLLVNLFIPPKRPDSDQDPSPKAQILGDVALPEGGSRKELITIGIKSPELFSQLKEQVGSDVVLDVGAFAPSKGTVVFFTRA